MTTFLWVRSVYVILLDVDDDEVWFQYWTRIYALHVCVSEELKTKYRPLSEWRNHVMKWRAMLIDYLEK